MDDLGTLAETIHREYEHLRRGLDAYFVIGRALHDARDLLKSNKAYGEWFRAQGFGFGTRWGNTLCSAADLEPRVREVMARSELSSERGQPVGFVEAVSLARQEQAERVKSRAPAPRRTGRRPNKWLAWLVAAGDIDLNRATSDDDAVAVEEERKARDALNQSIDEREARIAKAARLAA